MASELHPNIRAQRRALLALLAAGGAAPSVLAQASAGAYPQQPIKIIVPFAAGGPTDVLARAIGVKLTERWGQPVVIDNRVGAGGNIGAELAAKAAPPGKRCRPRTQAGSGGGGGPAGGGSRGLGGLRGRSRSGWRGSTRGPGMSW